MKISIFDLIIFLFGIFVISRVFLRFHSKELSLTGMIFWITIWFLILGGAFFPQLTTELANIVDIDRGADSAFFVSILILFYLIFRLYIKIDNIDKDITKLSIETAKQFHKNKQENKI